MEKKTALPPKITIITVCFNAVDSIENTIRSVCNQTYSEIEYIVIDGASTDGTIDLIKKHTSSITIWISEPDGGLYDALNKGISLATGDWIGILNCGDLFSSPNVIRDLFCDTIPSNVGVVYGDSVEIDKDVKIYHKAENYVPHKKTPPDYRHGASFVRSEIHKRILFSIGEKNKYSYGLDYHQIYRMHKEGVCFLHKDVCVLDYEKNGISNNPWKNKYLRSLIENDGIKNWRFCFFFLFAILKAIKNKFF